MENENREEIPEKELNLDFNSKRDKADFKENRILSRAAIFISILSFFAIIYQSYLGREENRLNRMQQNAAVLPYLDFWINENDNMFSLAVSNEGVGPAFRKDVNLKVLDTLNKDTLNFNNSDDCFDFLLKKMKRPLIDSLQVMTSTFQSNSLLKADKEKNMISIKFRERNVGLKFKEFILNEVIDFKVIYADVYGTQWYITSESEGPVKIISD
ncbi:MAG: hypothetical protein AAGF77_07025 [Bacteroidota bacterium]